MSQLEDLLQQCTVKLTLPGRMGWGTGFFVATGWILTCAHVVREAQGQAIAVRWQQQENWAQAMVEKLLPDYDLALLRVTLPMDANPPCVYLDEAVESRDPLYLFGYPDEGDRQGEPRTFNCDGMTGGEIPAILFNLGQVRPGMSGSPLLNQRTGMVCGMVKFTRDRSFDLGGGAIPTRVILEQLPELRELQREFHGDVGAACPEDNRRWSNLLLTTTHGSETLNTETVKSYLQSLSSHYEKWWDIYRLTEAISARQATFRFEQTAQTEEPNKKDPKKTETVYLRKLLQEIMAYAELEPVLLVGAPGVGKSTTLLRLLVVLAKQEFQKPVPRIPILVRLKDYQPPPSGSEDISGMLTLIKEALEPELTLEISEVKALLFQEKRLFLLLDGLNEIPANVVRSKLMSFRDHCKRAKIPLVCTTRNLDDDFGIQRRVDLQTLSPEEIQRFLSECMPGQEQQVLQLLNKGNQELGKTPFVLWMLYDVFSSSGRVPKSLGEAFRRFTKNYTNYKINQEGIPVSQETLQDWSLSLEYLAFAMLKSPEPQDPGLIIADRQAVSALTQLPSKNAIDRGQAQALLNNLLKYHLLQTSHKGEVSFCHQLIQEYYAAEYLLRILPDLSDEQLKREYLNYLKWTEAVALMLALMDDEVLTVRVVEQALAVDLMLGARLAGEVKQKFQEKMITLIDALSLQECLRIKLISKMNTPLAASVLEVQLREDPNPDSRKLVAIALRVMGYSSSEVSLIQALKDEEPDVRSAAASALGRLGTENSLVSLSTMLDDKNSYVLINVVNAIKNITARYKTKERGSFKFTSKYFQVKYKMFSFMQEKSNEETDSSKDKTLDYYLEDNAQEEQVVDVDKLINDLNTPDLMECGRVARKIGEMKLGLAVPALINLLPRAMNKSYAFEKVTKSLGYIRDTRAVSPLLQLLSSRILPKHLLKDVFNALAEIDVSTLLEPMRSILKSQDIEIRAALIYVLPGRKVNAPMLSQLTYVLQDSDSGIRGQVAAIFEEEGISENLNALWKAYQRYGELWFYEAIRSIQGHCKYYNYEIFHSSPAQPQPSQQDTLAKIGTTVDKIDQRTKQMSEIPNISIGTISGGIQNFTPNQGTQIGHQNNNYFGADDALLQQITELRQFITDLETQHPHIQTLPEAEAARDQAITQIQATNPTRWQTIRQQMRLLKRQLLNPDRHAQAAKATLVEITKVYWEQSLIAKAIVTYIDKLSETPDQGA